MVEPTIWAFVNYVCYENTNNQIFPGGMPISVHREDIPLLHGVHEDSCREYTVSFKADGCRMYLGFIKVKDKNVSFLMGRNGIIREIELKVLDEMYLGTLFDIEQIDNTLLIFDCAMVNGNRVNCEFYPHRLDVSRYILKTCLKLPHIIQSQIFPSLNGVEYPSEFENITITNQTWNLNVKSIFYTSKIMNIPSSWWYDDDGLIFTLASSPFFLRQDDKHNVMKWKPAEYITIDFYICTSQTYTWMNSKYGNLDKYRTVYGKYKLLITSHGDIQWFTSTNYSDIILPENEGVYECRWDDQHRYWQILKYRQDKTKSNHLSTICSTIQNMEDLVIKSDLACT